MSVRDLPIGVFDSGLGGLTVVRAIRSQLPNERMIYLGDNARIPYGTRSPSTVTRYARRCAAHLHHAGIKLLVVACNTVSAVALPSLRAELDVPVIGVIVPGAHSGVQAAGEEAIGVIATRGTVLSGAYPQAVAGISSRSEVFQSAAPLLVPLVEEGWVEGEVPRLAVTRYLRPLVDHNIRSLILGCTHYPLLKKVITEVALELSRGPVHVVDSALATAVALEQLLVERELGAVETSRAPEPEIWVTDLPDQFANNASRFLGRPVEALKIERVDL